MIVMDDMNTKLGDENVDEAVGKWGIRGQNESGEWLVDRVCFEQELFLPNAFFHHFMISY